VSRAPGPAGRARPNGAAATIAEGGASIAASVGPRTLGPNQRHPQCAITSASSVPAASVAAMPAARQAKRPIIAAV
jgi:hypothetical protein